MRTSVITGSASGIGQATQALLESRGERVIGIDLRGAEIVCDLADPEQRAALPDRVAAVAAGPVDAIIAVAGSALPAPLTVSVNYFGALATVEGLRPLLAGSPDPRAVLVTSMASLMPTDDALVAALTADDEQAALARAGELAADPATGGLIYASTKKALSQWVRRAAPTPDWAGAGIPLNAAAPGIIATPMVAGMIDTPQAREQLLELVPMPLNGIAEPIVVARLLAWLAGVENTHLCSQVVFVDGGSDVVIRGDSTW